MDEQRLERALRQGPPFATTYVPSSLALEDRPMARPPVGVGRLVLVIAVTALLLAGLVGGLVAVGMLQNEDRGASNGWVAFARWGSDPSAGPVERDIYVVQEGQAAHRIIGSDSDDLDQICPAFSPDGNRLAHGEAEGTEDSGYGRAALVVSDVDAEGNASESLRIDVGGRFPPPCAIWSPDGRWVAFGVPTTSPLNPDRSAAGSEVWVATVADGQVEVLSDLLATDLEWSPIGSQLAIASGQSDLVGGQRLRDGSIRLYDASSGEVRTLVGPSGVSSLTWSPDGSRIAYQRGQNPTSDGDDQEIWVAQVDGSGELLLASGFSSIHGIGPVWSPTGEHIVYQRIWCDGFPSQTSCGEQHEVVLVTPDGESEHVLPHLRLPGADESALWFPFRVTWSPEGRELLYAAWSLDGPRERIALISVPIDRGSDPAVLHEDTNISAYDGDSSLPIQSWGRRAGGQPTSSPEQPSAPSVAPASPSEQADAFPTAAFADISEDPVSEEVAAEFQAILIDMAGDGGMAATVMSPDGTWSGAAGKADTVRDVRIDDQFAIASVTKPIVAAQVVQMVEAGELSLDDLADDHLPPGLDFDTNGATIRHLLSHRSGIPDYFPAVEGRLRADLRRVWTPADLLELVPASRTPAGEVFEYTDTNYLLLGLVIEDVRGRPVHEVLRAGVLSIDGVERLIYQPGEVPTEPMAMPDSGSVAIFEEGGGYLPSVAQVTADRTGAAMASDTPSLARWWRAFCAGEIVSQASLTEMSTFHSPDEYGLGLFVVADPYERASVGHTGSGDGYVSWAGCLPEYGAVVVVLTNQVFDDIGGMARPLVDALGSD